ncbi:uncharacterized protein LOC125945709 [Dermacentor silvarum]|uniref:uncharacterized protein LOC125945709 n=1 Tax=Dermacentor silvarum TaxID=543639 RepID=UPI0021018074|nr:uncharacterized protein LOC125945709 [Dermacentor silvarum]
MKVSLLFAVMACTGTCGHGEPTTVTTTEITNTISRTPISDITSTSQKKPTSATTGRSVTTTKLLNMTTSMTTSSQNETSTNFTTAISYGKYKLFSLSTYLYCQCEFYWSLSGEWSRMKERTAPPVSKPGQLLFLSLAASG